MTRCAWWKCECCPLAEGLPMAAPAAKPRARAQSSCSSSAGVAAGTGGSGAATAAGRSGSSSSARGCGHSMPSWSETSAAAEAVSSGGRAVREGSRPKPAVGRFRPPPLVLPLLLLPPTPSDRTPVKSPGPLACPCPEEESPGEKSGRVKTSSLAPSRGAGSVATAAGSSTCGAITRGLPLGCGVAEAIADGVRSCGAARWTARAAGVRATAGFGPSECDGESDASATTAGAGGAAAGALEGGIATNRRGFAPSSNAAAFELTALSGHSNAGFGRNLRRGVVAGWVDATSAAWYICSHSSSPDELVAARPTNVKEMT